MLVYWVDYVATLSNADTIADFVLQSKKSELNALIHNVYVKSG